MLAAAHLLDVHKEVVLRATPTDATILDICIQPTDRWIHEKVPRHIIAVGEELSSVHVLPLNLTRPRHMARLKLELVQHNIYRVFLRSYTLDIVALHGLQRELQRYGGVDILVFVFDTELAQQMVKENALSHTPQGYTDGSTHADSVLKVDTVQNIFLGHWAMLANKSATDLANEYGVNLTPNDRRIAELYRVFHFQVGCSWTA